MTRLIGNAVVLIAATFMMIGAAIGLSIVFIYAVAVVLLKRLTRSQPPVLTAGG